MRHRGPLMLPLLVPAIAGWSWWSSRGTRTTLLFDNALKFSAPDGEFKVRFWEEGGQAIIAVAENGRGIPSADLPYIQEELFHGSNAMHVEGNGLGLPWRRRSLPASEAGSTSPAKKARELS